MVGEKVVQTQNLISHSLIIKKEKKKNALIFFYYWINGWQGHYGSIFLRKIIG